MFTSSWICGFPCVMACGSTPHCTGLGQAPVFPFCSSALPTAPSIPAMWTGLCTSPAAVMAWFYRIAGDASNPRVNGGLISTKPMMVTTRRNGSERSPGATAILVLLAFLTPGLPRFCRPRCAVPMPRRWYRLPIRRIITAICATTVFCNCKMP